MTNTNIIAVKNTAKQITVTLPSALSGLTGTSIITVNTKESPAYSGLTLFTQSGITTAGHLIFNISAQQNNILNYVYYFTIDFISAGQTYRIADGGYVIDDYVEDSIIIGQQIFENYSKAEINTYTGQTHIHLDSIDLQLSTLSGNTDIVSQNLFQSHTGNTTVHTTLPIVKANVSGLVTDLANMNTYTTNLSMKQSTTIYFLDDTNNTTAGYKSLLISPLITTTTGVTKQVSINNNTVVFESFATIIGEPYLSEIPAGMWVFHSHVQFSSVTGYNYLHWDVYTRNLVTSAETFLFRATCIDISVTTLQEYQVSTTQPAYNLGLNDVLVVKISAQTTGNAKTATLTYSKTYNFGFVQPPVILVNAPVTWDILENDLGQIQTIARLYADNHISDISGYLDLLLEPLTITGVTKTVSLNNNTVLIDSFITPLGLPAVLEIPAGVWHFRCFAQWSAATGYNYLHFDVYKRTSGGTETLINRISTADIGVITQQQYQLEVVLPKVTLLATDRIVLKMLAQTTGGAKTATINYGGMNQFCFVQPPVTVLAAPFWINVQSRPTFLTGLTLASFEAAHAHSQYIDSDEVGSIAPYNIWTGSTAQYAGISLKLNTTLYLVTS
jgi:hypothetical protein